MSPLLQVVFFACVVAAAYYVLARAEISRWFWQGVIQAPSVVRRCGGGRVPNHAEGTVRCNLAAGHSSRCLSRYGDLGPTPRHAHPPIFTRGTRLRQWLDSLLMCANCCGWWLGLILASFLPLPVHGWLRFPAGGVLGMTLGAAAYAAMTYWKHQETRTEIAIGHLTQTEETDPSTAAADPSTAAADPSAPAA